MTLTHLFKAQAVFLALWFVMMWAMPQMIADQHGFEVTGVVQTLMQMVGTCFLALAIINWMMPSWAGDNLKKAGMVLGVYINIIFIAMQLYHLSVGLAKFDPMGLGIGIIFTALFIWKTRPDS
tara:strand:+ start:977 stop:1345 length:369 start_codon:yes stop_codon:yes gene_type:complete